MELVATLLVYASRLSNHTAGLENRSMKKCRNTGWKFAQISPYTLYLLSKVVPAWNNEHDLYENTWNSNSGHLLSIYYFQDIGCGLF